jgi:hypothetical protein
MTVIATSSNRFSSAVKFELAPEVRYCRDVVTVNDAAATFTVGAVLGKYIASPTATAVAGANTGNGVMGAITMTSNANLQLGVYTLRIVTAVTNAGDFELLDPQGKLVGIGHVASAFNQGGFSFTLADGSSDYVAGDTYAITVAGTEKYKLVDVSHTDGSEVARAVYIADVLGNSYDVAIPANTDTTVLVLSRGPVIVADSALSYAATVNTTPLKNALYAQLKNVGILVSTAL